MEDIGDEVFVVLGCDVPMLLRPKSDGEYQVVGDCYGMWFSLEFVPIIPPFSPVPFPPGVNQRFTYLPPAYF